MEQSLDNETPFFYVFVRKDIPPHYQMIQAAHASLEIGRLLVAPKRDEAPTHLCLFEVQNEKELIGVSRELKKAGVLYHMFYESDHSTGFSAIATEPLIGTERSLMSGYVLYSTETRELVG